MAGERVTNLKVLKGYLYADVRLGHDANGSETTIAVRLNTGRAEVQEALEPLYDLLRSTGRSLTIEAVTEADVAEARRAVEAEIRAQIPDRVERAVTAKAKAIDEAILVVRSVGPERDDDPYSTLEKYNRRSALKRLRDAIQNARL